MINLKSQNNLSTILDDLSPDVFQTYQAIRFSKMDKSNRQSEQIIDFSAVYQTLILLPDDFIHIRVHYSIFDLEYLDNIGNSIIQLFLKYNHPCKFDFIFNSDEYKIIDIKFSKELLPIYFTDSKLISLLENAFLLEIQSKNTNNNSFLGFNITNTIPTQYILNKLGYAHNSIIRFEKPPEYIDLWLSLLQETWGHFIRDVRGKECSLVYFSHGKYKIRRKFADSQSAIFTNIEDLRQLKELQVVSIIPNCHEQVIKHNLLTVEAIIDIDPSRFSTDNEKMLALNLLTEYLLNRGLVFYKRSSGGVHAGFHVIVPLEVKNVLSLVTNVASPQNYFNNLPEKIIINSVRETILALLLDFLKEYKSYRILDFASIEPDPYKIRYEISRTSYKIGRRALYSMHKGTNKIVVPLIYNKTIDQDQLIYYDNLSLIDQAFAHTDALKEETISFSQIKKNSLIIELLNQENQDTWKSYHMASNKTSFLKNM